MFSSQATVTTPCFWETAVAYKNREITTAVYFQYHLEHFRGVRHDSDNTSKDLEKLIEYDPVCGALKACVLSPGFQPVQDIATLQRLLIACWQGRLEQAEALNQRLNRTESDAFVLPLIQVLLMIGIRRHQFPLLEYILELPITSQTVFVGLDVFTLVSKYGFIKFWIIVVRKDHLSHRQLECLMLFAMLQPSGSLSTAKLVDSLLSHGLKVNRRMLREAITHLDARTLQTILSYTDARKINKSLGLFVAVHRGDLEILKILLDAGMNINFIEDMFSWDGLDPRERSEQEHSGRDNHGALSTYTALHLAVMEGKRDIVRLLLERRARTDIKDWLRRSTPEVAVRKGDKTTIELFDSEKLL